MNILPNKQKIFISILCATVLFTGCFDKKEDKKAQVPQVKAKEVNIHTISKTPYPIWVDFSGKTDAYKTIQVVARVKGELEKRFFKAGDLVKKGDILFHIEDTEYKSLLAQAQAGLKKSQASHRLAIATYNRYKPLVDKELAPKEKLDQLEAQVLEHEASILADKAAIKKAKQDLYYTDVRATIDGQIGKTLIDIGNTVGTSADTSNLAKIVQSNPLYVNFYPSTETAQIILKYKSEEKPRIIVKVPIRNNSNYETFKGNVDFIDNITDQTSGTVNFRAIIENPKYQLLPGTFVEIQMFISDQIPVLGLSPMNVMEDQLGSFVYVVNDENKIEKKHFEVAFSNKKLIIIKGSVDNNVPLKFKDTIQAGDRIVVSSMIKLRPGIQVNATETKNPIKK